MKLVLQRVKSGSVTVDNQIVSQIKNGLVCFIGIGTDDTQKDLEYGCDRIMKTKLWPNEEGKAWKKSVVGMDYEVIIVSQFTLHAVVNKNKPDFRLSMSTDPAKDFYDRFVEHVKSKYPMPEKVKEGVFGAMMDVSLVNDGPVTITLDSKATKRLVK